jgi:Domain of unknown function (DUF1854)
MSTLPFQFEPGTLGRLVLISPEGARFEGCTPVRAFALSAPDEGISLVSLEGYELAWIERLSDLSPTERSMLEAALAEREFSPTIRRIVSVSTFSTPSLWRIETDAGPTTLQLGGEEDIRRLATGMLLIADIQGLHFQIPEPQALDRASRKLLERFL